MHGSHDYCEKAVAKQKNAVLVPDAAVADVFRAVFELETVQPEDNFFRLGGDSLLAETLMTAIKAEFDIELPISVLVETSTPKALASLIRERRGGNKSSNLMVARSGGSRPPLVCVHGANGDSLTAFYLAEVLAPGRIVYGFRASGLENGEAASSSVEEIAGAYIKAYRAAGEMREPVFLLGHCAASVIAYEMAQQLTAAGCNVGGLILIDPAVGKGAPFLQGRVLSLANRGLQRARRYFLHRRRAAQNTGMNMDQRRAATKRAIQFATRCNTPSPLAVPCLFIYTSARRALVEKSGGYKSLLPKGEFVEFNAEHAGIFSKHAVGLGLLIDRFLESADCVDPNPITPVTA